jgi:hypothetical protein
MRAAAIGSRIPSTVQTSELSDPAGMMPMGIVQAASTSSLLDNPLMTWNQNQDINVREIFLKLHFGRINDGTLLENNTTYISFREEQQKIGKIIINNKLPH